MTFNEWMNEYAESHQNPTNQIIHKICVPLITFSVIGILWSIPFPVEILSGVVNWGTLFILFCLGFYLKLKPVMGLAMFIESIIFVALCYFLNAQGWLLQISIGIFILSWIFQFIGHKIEGKKPSFFKDIQFLLIGPLWVLKWAFDRLGLKV